jgi:hypothetical protein
MMLPGRQAACQVPTKQARNIFKIWPVHCIYCCDLLWQAVSAVHR